MVTQDARLYSWIEEQTVTYSIYPFKRLVYCCSSHCNLFMSRAVMLVIASLRRNYARPIKSKSVAMQPFRRVYKLYGFLFNAVPIDGFIYFRQTNWL